MKKSISTIALLLYIAPCCVSRPIKSFKEFKSEVQSIGSRLDIIKRGQLSGNINLQSIQSDQLFAIGPVIGLRGEITIYDGIPYISTLSNEGGPMISQNWRKDAVFLVYGKAQEWEQISIEKSIRGLKAIEEFVRIEASSRGVNLDVSFPFRIEGVAKNIIYHIIYKKNGVPHNKFEHHKAKRKFKLKDHNINIIGFWSSKDGEGVYTHPGMRTHLHFISQDKKHSGHIDEIELNFDSKLFLPVTN